MTTNAILATETLQMSPSHSNPATPSIVGIPVSSDDQRWNAVVTRDAAHDGEFVFAVSSTGVYCRPSCPARRPRRKNVQFFATPDAAEQGGYRACLRCRPRSVSGNAAADGIKAICRFI
jgi:AraC family transcriptional regulator of adaptative response/methylated-DNA-[protein]-cysteine methyltransferase